MQQLRGIYDFCSSNAQALVPSQPTSYADLSKNLKGVVITIAGIIGTHILIATTKEVAEESFDIGKTIKLTGLTAFTGVCYYMSRKWQKESRAELKANAEQIEETNTPENTGNEIIPPTPLTLSRGMQATAKGIVDALATKSFFWMFCAGAEWGSPFRYTGLALQLYDSFFDNTTEESTAKWASLKALKTVALINALDGVPDNFTVRILVDGILMTTACANQVYSVVIGIKLAHQAGNEQNLPIDQQIQQAAKGITLTALGIYGLNQNYEKSIKYLEGIEIYQKLPEENKYGVIKNGLLPHLSEGNECKAIMIDSNSKKLFVGGTMLSPPLHSITSNCDTLIYYANSSDEFCEALEKGVEHFGTHPDLLLLFGHSSNLHMALGDNYRFVATDQEIKCIKNTVDVDGHIILAGCNTATPLSELPPLDITYDNSNLPPAIRAQMEASRKERDPSQKMIDSQTSSLSEYVAKKTNRVVSGASVTMNMWATSIKYVEGKFELLNNGLKSHTTTFDFRNSGDNGFFQRMFSFFG